MSDKSIDVGAGERVSGFLADEAVQAAFQELEVRYASDWRNGKTTDERELAWHRTQVLKDVLAQLKVVIGNGHMAQAALKAQARRSPVIP